MVKNRIIAIFIGILCHLSFIAGIILMAYSFYFGLTKEILPPPYFGRALNLILIFQFPLLHSFFLTDVGRMLLAKLYPKEIGVNMQTTSFALIASLQLICVFLFWTPSKAIWYAPSGVLLHIWTAVYILSWILLIVALIEAGLSLQTGYLGWSAVYKGIKPKYPKPSFSGLHGSCRHPIYSAFSLIILTSPIWSFDHFMLALVWVSYCIIGPKFKEKRYDRIFGKEFSIKHKELPYFFPKFPAILNKRNRIALK